MLVKYEIRTSKIYKSNRNSDTIPYTSIIINLQKLLRFENKFPDLKRNNWRKEMNEIMKDWTAFLAETKVAQQNKTAVSVWVSWLGDLAFLWDVIIPSLTNVLFISLLRRSTYPNIEGELF